jgi:hypothetical protein
MSIYNHFSKKPPVPPEYEPKVGDEFRVVTTNGFPYSVKYNGRREVQSFGSTSGFILDATDARDMAEYFTQLAKILETLK